MVHGNITATEDINASIYLNGTGNEIGSLTANADKLVWNDVNVYQNNQLNLTGGTLNVNVKKYGSGGTLNILGEVVNNNKRLEIVTNIAAEGELTTDAVLLQNTTTNNGQLNLHGVLSREILGASGHTKIENDLTLMQGAGIIGYLDLNNSIINTDPDSVNNHNLGTTSGVTDLRIKVDMGKGIADNFNLGASSTGAFDVSNMILLDNIINPMSDTGIVQVLKIADGTHAADPAHLTLNDYADGKKTFHSNIYNSTDPQLARPVVLYDESFEATVETGEMDGYITLATSNTANDSIAWTITNKEITSTTSERRDLLAAWVQYAYQNGDPSKFKFHLNDTTNAYAHDNEYHVTEDLGRFVANGAGDRTTSW